MAAIPTNPSIKLMEHINKDKYDIVPIYISKDRIWYTSPMLMDIEVYKDFGTGKLFVKEESGFMAPLEKTDLWKREGFSYSYQNIFGLEVAVKKF